LAGLIDLGEVSYISYGLSGAGETAAIGSQVGDNGSQSLVSDSGDGKKIFTREGAFGIMGRENLFDLSFQFLDRGGEGFDMPQQARIRSDVALPSLARPE